MPDSDTGLAEIQKTPEVLQIATTAFDSELVVLPAEHQISQGQSIGRYVVLGPLGAGGMGVVYAGYDPELDRKVAIKLLRELGIDPEKSGRYQRRLLREAQAMARLTHPNVVSVHDVGQHDGGVYIAMEFVEGTTLAQWLADADRSWLDVLDMYLAAGRGLVAAHAKGLIHRDFKPDNVMVGDDGRVRVMDFGLARSSDDDSSGSFDELEEDTARPSLDALSTPLTQAGAIMGTPAFMAPEQHLRQLAGPAADQFSFCVALWRGVYGQMPFEGESLMQLGLHVVEGELREPPASAVPRWLRRAITRGLSTKPDDRFPSMRALLEVLERGRAAQRRRPFVFAGVALGALGLAAVGVQHYQHLSRVDDCRAAGAQIEQTWSTSQREQVEQAVASTSLVYAADTVEHALPRLDAWAQSWSEHREQVCMSAEVAQLIEPELAQRSAQCFYERRLQLDALVRRALEADTEVVRELVEAVTRLPRVEPCADLHHLGLRPSRPEDSRDAFEEVWEPLARSRSLLNTGDAEGGETYAKLALELAERGDDVALIAEARAELGAAALMKGEFAEAERILTEAFVEAGADDAVEVAAMTSASLVYVVGYRLSRHSEGLAWSKTAEVYVQRLGSEPSTWRAALSNQLGAVHLARGDAAEAKALFERTLAQRESLLGEDHPAVASTLGNLAAVAHAQGDIPRAIEVQQEVVARSKDAFGSNHPYVAVALANLGEYHRVAGDLVEAKARLEEALASSVAVFGEEHPQTTAPLNNLGLVQQGLGDFDAAEAAFERVLEIRERVYDSDHPQIAYALFNLADVKKERGEFDAAVEINGRGLEALRQTLGDDHVNTVRALSLRASLLAMRGDLGEAGSLYQRVLEKKRATLGPDHVDVAETVARLAQIAEDTGDLEVAERKYAEALAIYERGPDPENPEVAATVIDLARLVLSEDPTRALSLAERAHRLSQSKRVRPETQARIRFTLAQALWATEPAAQRDRALGLARQARDEWTELGEAKSAAVADAWLAERSSDPVASQP